MPYRSVSQAFEDNGWSHLKWTIAGKGPSFDPELIRGQNIVALNHAVRELDAVRITHAVDIEPIVELGDELLAKSEIVVMPVCPNVGTKKSGRTCLDLASTFAAFAALVESGKLCLYNWIGRDKFLPGCPPVKVQWFSAEGAFGFLAACGVKSICSIGVDGGLDHAACFGDLPKYKHGPFDLQFPNIQKIVDSHGIDWKRLNVQT